MKVFITLVLTLLWFARCYAQDAPTAAPAIKTFALEPDISGAASNSVNLFTGDVALPLNLVSLPGQNGLDVNVSISYSSNVQDIVDTWNLEAPAGILGLGWSMDIPKIVADHKQTGTREDDTYYLLEGGSSNRLVRTVSGSDAGGSYYVYETKNYQFWRIKYYYDISEIYGSTSYGTGPNKWEITKEDGTRYIYGDKNSGRNTLRYTVRWKNWIGSSAQVDGQSQLVHAWNLSEIVNLWNNRITFEYDNVEQFVGSTSGQKHTEASYLKQITDANGKKVVFHYKEKHPQFFMEPHTEQAEPDAYQEIYERRYLDHVEVLQEAGFKMLSVHFTYKTLNAGTNTAKMLLVSIIQRNSAGNTLPGMELTYYASGDTKGMLQEVRYPTGGSISYVYTPTTITRSNRKLNITAPAGYAEPQMYFGADYVVVAWRALGSGNTHVSSGKDVKLYVYQWVGEWKEQFLQTIGNVELEGSETYRYYKDFQVITEDRFFAVLSRSGPSNNTYHLYIRHKDEGGRGNWDHHSATVDYGEGRPALFSGHDFVGVGSFKDDGTHPSHIYTFLGDSWRDDSFNQSIGDHYYTSANNYFISHNRDGVNGPEIAFHYLTPDKKWTTKNWTYSWLLFSSADYSNWHGTNGYALVMASSNPEYFYHWDLTYTNFSRADVLGTWNDDSYVFNVSNSLTGLVQKGSSTIGKVVRFDGKNWITSANFGAYYQYRVSYGDDYAIWTVDDRDRPVVGFRRQYDPNTLSWSDANLTYTPNETVFGNLSGHNPVRAGVNFFSFTDKIYFRKADGTWSADYTLTPPSGINVLASSLRIGTDKYFIYRYSNNANVVQFLKNGAISASDNTVTGKYDYNGGLALGTLDLVRGNTIATYFTSSINDATSLALYRIVGEKGSGALVDYPATLVTTHDGAQSHYTAFEYNAAKATFDVTGAFAAYNEVTTIPGSNSAASKPYGYTKTFFYNGLTSAELGVSFMAVDLRWSGIPYETQVFNAGNSTSPESATKSTYQTFQRDILNDEESKVEAGFYIRPIESIAVTDGIETKSTNELYDASTGLVTQTSMRRSNSFVARNYLKYWWEVYDNGTTPRSLHLLSPVIQTRKTYNDQTIEASATRWKDWTCAGCPSGSVPGVLDAYVWKRNGTGEFSAWGELDPVAPGEWKFVNSVKVDGKGRPFENTDISGNSNASLWHPTLPRLLANITNATLDQVLYEGFEDCVSGCTTDAKTGFKSSQTAYNVVLPSAGAYTLSYWSKSSGDWTLNVSTISSNTTIGGSGTLIDEVRLHPPGARMITYAYDDHGNVTSVCDENNRIAYTEYDEFNRVKLVRDTDQNIMKYHSYNFRVDD